MGTHDIEVKPGAIDFGGLHERMQGYVDQNSLSCCDTLLMKGDDVLDFRSYGFMDLESRRPLTPAALPATGAQTRTSAELPR